MKCNICPTEFNPHDNALLGHYDGDSVEVRTRCPKCGTGYYTFTGNAWCQEEHAAALIASERDQSTLPPGLVTPGFRVRAISIRQPWAWLIIHAGKDIENREWGSGFRGRCMIHAASTMTKGDYESCMLFIAGLSRNVPWRVPAFDVLRKQCGGIVGCARVVDCVTKSDSPWFNGPYGFQLAEAKALPFTPCKGASYFFTISGPVIARIVEAA